MLGRSVVTEAWMFIIDKFDLAKGLGIDERVETPLTRFKLMTASPTNLRKYSWYTISFVYDDDEPPAPAT